MKATITAKLLGVSPNPQRPDQEASASVQILVDGSRGQELKKVKIPLDQMMEMAKVIDEEVTMEIDVNEYSIQDDKTGKTKTGTSYKLWVEPKK